MNKAAFDSDNDGSLYIMEHSQECERLRRKTIPERVLAQASWAGLKPGMRVLDAGCGPGFTTRILNDFGTDAMGCDWAPRRIESARREHPDLRFEVADISNSLEQLGRFDFIWVRFVLEYNGRKASEIIRRLKASLNPGGILCCIDLDHNCLNHYPMDARLEATLKSCIDHLYKKLDWDPFVGRKLYTYLFDAEYSSIAVEAGSQHCIYGQLSDTDTMNWLKKLQVAVKQSGYPFEEYGGSFDAFFEEAWAFFNNPRRFTYTPLIMACGKV
ncbi:MAG: class I SAM-dependent methyltransferase [Spirochaetales bacterium]|nr:class I SAM-dependent methyltransferase [Spirochaetales bacterium]